MKSTLAICAGLLLACVVSAADNGGGRQGVNTHELDSAIRDVIAQPEYAWRLARQKETSAETGFWSAFFGNMAEWVKGALRPLVRPAKKLFKWLKHKLRKFADWLERLLARDRSGGKQSLGWQTGVRILLFVALAAALSFLTILLVRLWRNRTRPVTAASAFARPTKSDILEERVSADELPVDEWMAMARQFLESGEMRLAVRAMFLACLVFLANRDKLTIARHKSNREYIRELSRRAHDVPDVLAAFSDNVGILERLWYGMHSATEEAVSAFSDNQERILGTQSPRATPPAF